MNLKNTTMEEFIKNIGDKDIVCYGAGKLFEDMFITMEEAFLNKITAVFDSKPQGEYITIGKYKISCNSPSKLTKINSDKNVILITSMHCYTIYMKLKEYLANDNIDCYVYVIMSLTTNKSKCFKGKNDFSEQKIPKKIHYCWFGEGDMPEKNKRCIESWKRTCPEYEIVRWDESNYDWTKNKYMKQAYESKKWGFVPDYARLDIVYSNGGIYLDTDVELIKKPDELLIYDGYMGFQRNFWIALGLGFGAKKENLLIRQLRDYYNEIDFIDEHGMINLKAAPYYQTMFLKEKGIKCNNMLQMYKDNLILSTDYLDPLGYKNGRLHITDNTISIHHYDESWIDSNLKNKQMYDEIDKMYDYMGILH